MDFLFLVLLGIGLCRASREELFISSYVRDGVLKAIQIYNPSNEIISMAPYWIGIGNELTSDPLNDYKYWDYLDRSGEAEGGVEATKEIKPGETLTYSSVPPTSTAQGAAALRGIRDAHIYNLQYMTGKRWVVLFEEIRDSDGEIAEERVIDVVGDLNSTAPWAVAGTDTTDVAIVRTPAVQPNYPASDSYITENGFKWTPSEWVEAVAPSEIKSSDFTFLTYHYSDLFRCTQHSDCPTSIGEESGFCATENKCRTCDHCLSNNDAVDGSCLDMCEPFVAGCDAAVPFMSECVQCPARRSFPEIPPTPKITITDPHHTATVTWCSRGAYSGNSPDAEVEVNVTYYNAKTDAAMRSEQKTYPLASLWSPEHVSEASVCGGTTSYQYSADFDVSTETAYTPITASINLIDDCQTGFTDVSDRGHTSSAAPEWFTSNDASSRTAIVPQIQGSAGNSIIIAWDEPLKNCACDITEYKVSVSEDDGDFAERSDLIIGTSRTVVVTGLTSQKTYKFKISVSTENGVAESGESSTLLLTDMDLIISGYIEEGREKAIQLFNPTRVTVNTRDYALVLAQYSGSTSSGSLISRQIIKGEGPDDFVDIPPGGTVVLADHKSGPDILAYLPNNNFFKTGSGTRLANFNGNDWILLVTYDRDSDSGLDSAGRVLDVIGDSATSGPWSGSNFNTESVALSKKREADLKEYADYSAEDSVTYTWTAGDWSKAMEYDSDSSVLVGSYDWLGYHFSDLFICEDHNQCPSGGFCSAESKCETCNACVFDSDALDGICPDKCPATCGGDIFPGETCEACGSTLESTYKMPYAASAPVLKKSSNIDEAILGWCSPDDLSGLGMTSKATANVTVTFWNYDVSEVMYTRVYSYPIDELVSKSSSDCSHWYNVTIPRLSAYTTITAELLLYDKCQQPLTNPSNQFRTDPSVPTWFTSNNEETRSSIEPVVAGSTSEVAVLQWLTPLLNCPSCTVQYYDIYMSDGTSSEYTLKEEIAATQTLVLLRDLKTGFNYTFKVKARSQLGESDFSPVSPAFAVSAEVPDPSPLIYFEAYSSSPFSSVTANVVKGNENGDPISSFDLEYAKSSVGFKPGSFDTLTSTSSKIKLKQILEESTEYVFRAKLKNSVGFSEYSNDYRYNTSSIRQSTIKVEPEQGKEYRSANFTVIPGEKEDATITSCVLTLIPEKGGANLTISSTSPDFVSSEFLFAFDDLQPGTTYAVEAVIYNARNFVQDAFRKHRTTQREPCTGKDYELKNHGEDLRDGSCDDTGKESFREVKFQKIKTSECQANLTNTIEDTSRDTSIRCEYTPYKSRSGIINLAVCGLGASVCLSCCLFFFCNRKKKLIKMSQPIFLCSFCFSGFLANLVPIFAFGPFNEVNCAVRYILPNFIFTVYFGALVVKLYRVWLVLMSEKARTLKRIKVTPIMVVKLLGVWLVIDCIVLGTYAYWTAFWRVSSEPPTENLLGVPFEDFVKEYDDSVATELKAENVPGSSWPLKENILHWLTSRSPVADSVWRLFLLEAQGRQQEADREVRHRPDHPADRDFNTPDRGRRLPQQRRPYGRAEPVHLPLHHDMHERRVRAAAVQQG
eukprot:CAMPEP_0197552308 /NCGR_PEP_ID=MMETSP1320-20131121/5852_1 /TAXON_ID=91990 /ORGANISM="Bolidomonas sp., Strain RCC2347" /LENGTH=1582 /DNA_ID=CAMNT_0043112887 /DNA_START=13 /DNA_END=4760 /DNA_ORIENTATION=+